MKIIFLDSTPLALSLQKRQFQPAEECRDWIRKHLAVGDRILVSEIIDYEVRRELHRLQKARALKMLDASMPQCLIGIFD